MAQLPCIGLYNPYINLPFGDCAIYFYHGIVGRAMIEQVFFWNLKGRLENC